MAEKKSKLVEKKTKPTTASVEDFINCVQDEQKRKDSFVLLDMMKKAYHLIFPFLILFVCITGCEDEELLNQLQILGKWEWFKSEGGIGGVTLTPESEGYTSYLEIDNTTYRQYINDSLVFQSNYTYRSDTMFGIPEYIEFENGGAIGVKVSEYTLELTEFCLDCFVHFYGKE